MAPVRTAGLSGRWAVRLAAGEAAAAGSLRLVPGIEVCEAGASVWLRGAKLDEKLLRQLTKLPGAERFDVGPDGAHTPVGKRLPTGKLPERKWVRLCAWIEPKIARVAAPAGPVAPIAIRVVDGAPEETPRVLLTDASDWGTWAATAPNVRLAPLRFAADADGAILVWGHPLPPIRGSRYVEKDGLAVPCGCRLAPAVDGAILRSVLELAPGDLAVFGRDGAYDVAPVESLVPATRTAVRRTLAGLPRRRT